MDRDDIIRMAREVADIQTDSRGREEFIFDSYGIEAFANLVAAAEREKVAEWMMARAYATGHGETTEELLEELGWQIEEKIAREREACAKVCEAGTGEPIQMKTLEVLRQERKRIAKVIRARGDYGL